ncbi:hypothetical protein ABWI01_02895 [Oceanicaulis alexandrii]|uniref:hypothetical protein n=1 Tax=Oceanicaulis alexandrii TaxID=153233 RepID=UPI0035D0FFF7
MIQRVAASLPHVLTAMIFIACWTVQVCAQPIAPAGQGHAHGAGHAQSASDHHQMSGHAHHAAAQDQADPHCDENALCGAALVLSDAPQIDAPAVLPTAPRPDLAQLRRTAVQAPAYDAQRPRPPPRPTPVQLHSVQLN